MDDRQGGTRLLALAAIVAAVLLTGSGTASAPAAARPHQASVSTPGTARGSTFATGGPQPVELATASTPKAAAREEAGRLLGAVTVPPGSRSVATAPVPALDQPDVQPQSSDLVDSPAWWTVPLSTADALDWLRAHPPAGVTIDGSGTEGGQQTSLLEGTAGTRQYQPPQLVLSLAPLGPNASALRADAQVVWIPERSPAEQAPTDAGTTVTIAYRRNGDSPLLGRRTLAGTAAHRVAVAYNDLQVLPPGSYSCPADTGFSIELRFPAGLVATTGGGCPTVAVTAPTGPQPGLALDPTLEGLLLTLLHLPPNAPYQH